jgi:hypothetical protein
MNKKKPTFFDVFNKMPQESICFFRETAGGRMIGNGKEKNGIIEMLVDNDTFQDFAFQKTYGHPKGGKKELVFIMFAIDADEYQKQFDQLKK